ncbi:hypothetical protein FKM82_010582 [Ascaphus truei]
MCVTLSISAPGISGDAALCLCPLSLSCSRLFSSPSVSPGFGDARAERPSAINAHACCKRGERQCTWRWRSVVLRMRGGACMLLFCASTMGACPLVV